MKRTALMLGVCLMVLCFSGCAYQSALHTAGQNYTFRIAFDSYEDE